MRGGVIRGWVCGIGGRGGSVRENWSSGDGNDGGGCR